MLCHSFSQLNPSGDSTLGCAPDAQTQAEIDLQMEMQLQQDIDFSSYSWDDNTTMWQTGAEVLLGDDFDLNLIPPIELGLPKFGDDMSLVDASPVNLSDYQEYGQPMEGTQFQYEGQNLDGLLGFKEILAGHGF